MSLRNTLRRLVGKLPAWLVVVAAAVGFWVLSRGMTLGQGAIVGYAEEVLHSIGPLQPGRLKALPVHIGQEVKAGEVVAELDGRALELRRERLLAELAQAKAKLTAESDLQSAMLQRNQIQAVNIYADEKRARAELAELDQQVQRLTWLKSQHLVRDSDLEDARRRQRAMAADLQARPAGTAREMQLLGLRPRPQSEQAQRLEDRLAPYHAAVTVSESALREVDYAISELSLRAPVAGTIGAILQRPGDALTAGTPVVTVVTTRKGTLVAFLPERQLAALAAGAVVQVRRTSGLFAPWQRGHVVELAPLVEELPPRARHAPTVPLWGRRVVILLDSPVDLLPGEAFHVSAR